MSQAGGDIAVAAGGGAALVGGVLGALAWGMGWVDAPDAWGPFAFGAVVGGLGGWWWKDHEEERKRKLDEALRNQPPRL